MKQNTFIDYIKETDNLEFVSDLSQDLNNKNALLFKCKLDLLGQKVPITLLISERFPRELPVFFLEKFDRLGFLPHIEPKGNICYLEKESIYINEEEPKAVFQVSVELAIETLRDGLTGANKNDFREEFHVFWERNNSRSLVPVISVFEVNETVKKINLHRNEKVIIISDIEQDINNYKAKFFNKTPMLKYGSYIPLLKDCEIIPPRYDEQWDADELINWVLPLVSKENLISIINLISEKDLIRSEYLIFGIPRETGPIILAGVQLKPNKNRKHPLLETNSGWGSIFLNISRLDIPSILPRGGAKVELQNKKILLVGCGSVGSHLALDLIKLGLGSLTLVDDDSISIENLQRYALGLIYYNYHKTEALKDYLTKNYFTNDIQSFTKKIEEFLELEETNIKDYDLVISTTGDPTINLFLNKLTRDENVSLIIGWNEPYGIGGHAQLSDSSTIGCYKCLYRNNYNIASFADKDQEKVFHKKHLGCGEVYTPYNALDSIKTSELMARLAIKYLMNDTLRSQIISWKGDSEEFTEQEFIISSRYKSQNQEQMNNNKFDFINPECSHCKKL